MHTLRVTDGCWVSYNSDWSGCVLVTVPEDECTATTREVSGKKTRLCELELPASLLIALAEAVVGRRCERAEDERRDDRCVTFWADRGDQWTERYEQLEATTLEGARAEMLRHVAAHYKEDKAGAPRDGRIAFVLLEVAAVHEVDAAPMWAERRRVREEERAQRAEARERAEYERLREKFAPGGEIAIEHGSAKTIWCCVDCKLDGERGRVGREPSPGLACARCARLVDRGVWLVVVKLAMASPYGSTSQR